MKFGLIGNPLGHSFSKAYFTAKFQDLGLTGFTYDNYPLPNIDDVFPLLHSEIAGLNVTLPYKKDIIHYLHEIDREAFQIGAVNTLARTGDYSWKGFNTDASAFRETLLEWIGVHPLPSKALVLGTGGAAKAVSYALLTSGIEAAMVSREGNGDYVYSQLTKDVMLAHLLVINTTPLGMEPDVTSCPPIPFEYITSHHWCYDLVYNPANTLFLARGKQSGARTKNGLDMLHLQAEHAWSIWKLYGKF